MKMNKLILCGVGVVFLAAGSECFAVARKPANFEGETTGREKPSAQTQKKSESISEPRPTKLAGSEETKQKKRIIAEGQEIRFLDEDNRLLKKISLESKDEYKTREGKKYKTNTHKNAAVSKNKQFAVLSENEYETVAITETGEEKTLGEKGKRYGKIALCGVDGKILFEKTYPEGRNIGKALVSDTGVVAGLVSDYWDEMPVIHAYDREGSSLLTYPDGGEQDMPSEVLQISPSGRYLAVRGALVAVFFDVINKTSWKADKDYGIVELNNDGIAKVTPGPGELYSIDLKEHLGN